MPLNNKDVDRTALIDGDIIAYRMGFAYDAGEDFFNFEDAICALVFEWTKAAFCHDIVVCLSDSSNFRKEVTATYKSNRKDQPKPTLLSEIKSHLQQEFECITLTNLEADDVMGMYSQEPNHIMVSIDKDMQTVPGWLFNPNKDEFPREISEVQADYALWTQMLTGDRTDGIAGINKVGPKKAEKFLSELSPASYGPSVLEAYLEAGLTEQEFVQNYRCLRILRSFSEYDRESGMVNFVDAF